MVRKGITPVVAIVLLLMMTVTAAGAAFAWTQGVLQGQQEQTSQRLNTEVTLRSLDCAAGGSSPELQFYLDNTGSVTVPASASGSVTVYLYNVSTGDLVDTVETSRGSDIKPGEAWDGSISSFPGANMKDGLEYKVQFEFTNQGSYTVSGTCQAS